MSQRRGAAPRSSGLTPDGVGEGGMEDRNGDDDDDDDDDDPLIRKARTVRSLQLEPADAEEDAEDNDGNDPDGEVARHRARLRHWRASPFACGLVEPTWAGQRTFHRRLHGAADTARDETGCLCCSARLCPLLGAGRVGHMVVLRSSHEWVEELVDEAADDEATADVDAETGGERPTGVRRRRYTRPRLDCVVGPYWPMLVTVTYPLILGVSGWVFVAKVWPGALHPAVALAWVALTVGLVAALAFTACRDPGILYRHARPPPQADGEQWRWSEATLSYRPRTAVYDPDTAVVVEGFDHTCPWTGTAIGKKNMLAFQCFVALVFIMLMVDIFMLTGVMDRHYS